MHIGLFMECDHRLDQPQHDAFEEAFAMAEAAEKGDLDGVWLSEHHFAPPWDTVGYPSVVASPLIWATAIASRTSRLRVGTAVLVLPLGHPLRLAEEVATLDNISKGRLDLGIGRSALPIFYDGYGFDYGESRERFGECLDVMRAAWTQERFSHKGKYYAFDDVCLTPKPYQEPHPPLRAAASSKETFLMMGSLGLPIFVGSTRGPVAEMAVVIQDYRTAWQEAGHPGEGDVMLRVPVYVAENMEKALFEPEASTMHSFGRLARNLKSAGPAVAEQAELLANITYEELLREQMAYGTPEAVTEQLVRMRDVLGLSGIIIETNLGGRIAQERVAASMDIFCEEVVPALR